MQYSAGIFLPLKMPPMLRMVMAGLKLPAEA
jgi:hypothetical protein